MTQKAKKLNKKSYIPYLCMLIDVHDKDRCGEAGNVSDESCHKVFVRSRFDLKKWLKWPKISLWLQKTSSE